jgi:hypothetical protein
LAHGEVDATKFKELVDLTQKMVSILKLNIRTIFFEEGYFRAKI